MFILSVVSRAGNNGDIRETGIPGNISPGSRKFPGKILDEKINYKSENLFNMLYNAYFLSKIKGYQANQLKFYCAGDSGTNH